MSTTRRTIHSSTILGLVLATLFSTLALTPAAPASAWTTVTWSGAGGQPRIGVIGDSTLAAMRWYGEFDTLRALNFTYDAESCRRTTDISCRGREGYPPPNALDTMRHLEGRLGRVLVLMTGYDDPGYAFGDAVDTIMAEAIRQGIPHVMWLTMRTADVSYVGPTYHSNVYTFRDNNRILLAKAQRYAGRLQIADWATYSASHGEWVESDGVHLTRTGASALGTFIVARSRAVIAGRTVTPDLAAEPATWAALRRGDRGPRVAMVQSALIRLGYSLVGGADGVFGAYTEAAVKTFQRRAGYTATGVVDTRTATRLGVFQPSATEPTCVISIPLQPGDTIRDVACLERHLRWRGFGVSIDSVYDTQTRTAVDFINYARGWGRDGVADASVLRAIGAWKNPPRNPPFCAASRVLRPGDRGLTVRCLKRQLFARGYRINTDNLMYGATLTNAVRHFQRHLGVKSGGVAWPATLTALRMWNPRCTVSRALGPTTRGRDVMCLEQHLAGRGYVVNASTPAYERATRRAVWYAEQWAGLPTNGIADKTFLARIGAWAPSRARVADQPAEPSPPTTVAPPTTVPPTTVPPTTAPPTTEPPTVPPTTVPPTTVPPTTVPPTVPPTTVPPSTAPPTSGG